jgi:hypothetical protein
MARNYINDATEMHNVCCVFRKFSWDFFFLLRLMTQFFFVVDAFWACFWIHNDDFFIVNSGAQEFVRLYDVTTVEEM